MNEQFLTINLFLYLSLTSLVTFSNSILSSQITFELKFELDSKYYSIFI